MSTQLISKNEPVTEKKKKRPYLHEVDLMRLIFISGVLLNHVTSAFAQNMVADSTSKLILHASHLALHFTRMGFMFMTGLVLFLNYYHKKDNNWFTFWKKRYSSVGVAYIAWNAILLLITDLVSGTIFEGANYGAELWDAIIHGNQFYLYYVFVIFQLYLLFPLLVKLFKKLPNYHNQLMVLSFILQLIMLVFIKYYLPNFDRSNWLYLFKAYGLNILVYQVYFMAGAYTAIHYQEVTRFLTTHAKAVVRITAVLSIGTVGLYFFNQNVLQLSFSRTEIVHQPYIMVYALCMVACVFILGKKYAAYREQGMPVRLDKLIKLASKISFGLYLSQTIPLMMLYGILGKINYLAGWQLLLLLPIGYAFVWGASFGISYFCYKVFPFGYLIGRPQKFMEGAPRYDKINQSVEQSTKKLSESSVD
jgi:hypothetical protein